MAMMDAEELAVGCMLSIRTTLGDEFEGQVVTFDRPSNILVLEEGFKHGPRPNIRLLNTNYIKDFTFLGQYDDPLHPNNCFLDLTALQTREQLAIRLMDKSVRLEKHELHYTCVREGPQVYFDPDMILTDMYPKYMDKAPLAYNLHFRIDMHLYKIYAFLGDLSICELVFGGKGMKGEGSRTMKYTTCERGFTSLPILTPRMEKHRQAEADAERIGVGVTTVAQSIFDALSKTLPVRWDKTMIVVMNEVRVGSPYN